MRDRAALAFGILAIALGLLALWAAYGQVDWGLIRFLGPATLVVAGASVLVLSRKHN